MGDEEIFIAKISKSKNQNRVTIPKEVDSDYVALTPIELPNIFKERKKYKDA